jgi:hypothetical protein
MNSTPRRAARHHYDEAERILAALPRHGLDPAQLIVLEPLAAIAHAVLATAPRRRGRHADSGHVRPSGGSPRDRWLLGDDEQPDDEGHR